jgi:transcriptional antiterminator NusG
MSEIEAPEELNDDWYLVFCFDGREPTVRNRVLKRIRDFHDPEFEEDHVRHFVREASTRHPESGKRIVRRTNPFPGIVMLKYRNIPNNLRAALFATSYIFKVSEHPLTVDDFEKMDKVYQDLDKKFQEEEKKVENKLRPVRAGDNVKVLYGAFYGCSATVQETLDNNKLKVLINVFGRDTPLEINSDLIELL